MYVSRDYGWIEVIVGPMYSGKSEELIRRIKRAKIARQNVMVFKPVIDNRYSKTCVVSHDGDKEEAICIQKAMQILDHVAEETEVVAIDEFQFFDNDIVMVCKKLADKNKRVICAGLDMDFRGEPFGPVPEILAVAERVDKISAICVVCGSEGTRTQRLINGKPAKYSDPIVLVGAHEAYEARCRKCHIVPKD